MQNEEGKIVDLYLPRKCSATNRLIPAKEHGAVQLNVAQVDEGGNWFSSTLQHPEADMARVAGPTSIALAAGGATVWASEAFTAAKFPSARTAPTQTQIGENPRAATFSSGSALAVPAAAALVAGLAQRQRRTRVTAEAVLTKDSAGRFRFAVEGSGGGSPAPEPSSGGQFDPATQVGVTDPLGFFDPLGFSKVGDEEGFRKLREAELKHARVAMMAAAGLLVQSIATFGIFEGTPKGIYAAITPPGAFGFALLFVASGVLELFVWKQDPSKEVGDFGDPAGWGIFNKDPDPKRRAEWVLGFRQRELNNGRFAMFASIGIILAEIVSGKTAWAQFGLTFEGSA